MIDHFSRSAGAVVVCQNSILRLDDGPAACELLRAMSPVLALLAPFARRSEPARPHAREPGAPAPTRPAPPPAADRGDRNSGALIVSFGLLDEDNEQDTPGLGMTDKNRALRVQCISASRRAE